MSIINDIRACLDSHLVGTAGIPSIAHQNVEFNPTTGTSFIKADLVPNSRRPAVRGLNPQKLYTGFYNLLVCTPEGQGSGAGYDIADLLLERFDCATDILYTKPTGTTPIIVSIEYSEVGTSYLDSPYYCTPVTVSWYIYHL